MDQATEFVQSNKGMLSTIALLVVLLAILYVVYQYLYPAEDPTYTQFLKKEESGKKTFISQKVPSIYTGGDFTFSFWLYIDDFNYRASSYKHLFSINPTTPTSTSTCPIVGVLTPLTNGLMVRANTVASNVNGSAPGTVTATATSAGGSTPDITQWGSLQQLVGGQTSVSMFTSTVDAPCDVKDVPLQRWVNVTVVSSGRVLDVYMDGKLARSCVLESSVNVPRGPMELRMCDAGGFGGRISSAQMWSTQLTPDVIYGIYMMGPTQTQHNIFTDVAKWLNINVSFTGSSPGQPTSTQAPTNPFQSLYSQGTQGIQSLEQGGSSLMQRL